MADPTLNTITTGESLGRGSCGEVFAVEGTNAKALVVKQFNSMAVDRLFLSRNFARLRSMPDHEGVAKVHDFRFANTPYAVLLQRIEGETLEKSAGAKEGPCWKLVRQLADALGEAHKHGAVHGHLHPGNILVRHQRKDDPRLSVTDFGTGMIGEAHHVDIGDTLVYAAPEQIETAGTDWEDGRAQRWDVYSFGVIAFFLINERLPRGLGYLKQLDKQRTASGGRPVPIDPGAFLDDIHETPGISWGMGFGVSQEHKLFREIVDDCLSLDPAKRPVDMREVRNRFRALDHRFALEDAEHRVVKEKRKQRAKLFGARAVAACLGASFLLATFYLVEYLRKSSFFENKVTELDQVVVTQRATISHLDEQWAETESDLRNSREAADSFFQKMARGAEAGGSGTASLKEEDLEKSREYYEKTLADVADSDENALERARALHSLAHIERKLGLTEKAREHFRNAITSFEGVLEREEPAGETAEDIHLRLADSHESVTTLLQNPIGDAALASLQKAVHHFDLLLADNPNDAEVVTRLAGTSFKLGRAYEAHRRYPEAIDAYSKSAEHATAIRDSSPEENEDLTELIGKLQFSAAASLAKAGRVDEAIDAHIASMETLEQLRRVDGFSPVQTIQLASSFLELGELFSTKEATNEDLDQLYNEALRLLTPLNTQNPEDVEVAVLLCRSLSHLGTLERSEGRWSAGYRLSTQGIEALKESLGEEPHDPAGLLVLAESRREHLRFLETEREAALKIAEMGIETLEQAHALVSEEGRVEEPQRTEVSRRLEELLREYGEVCEQLGDFGLAARCLELAETKRVVSGGLNEATTLQ